MGYHSKKSMGFIGDHMILPVSKNMDGIGVDAILSRNCRVEGCPGVAGGYGWIM